jgi:hypothetical protein
MESIGWDWGLNLAVCARQVLFPALFALVIFQIESGTFLTQLKNYFQRCKVS